MSKLIQGFFNPLEQKQTWLHKLNPALKVGTSLILLVMICLPTSLLLQLIVLLFITIMLVCARISKSSILTILKTCLIIFIVVFLISWLVGKNPRVIIDLATQKKIWGFDWQRLYQWGWIKQTSIFGQNTYWYVGKIWGGWIGDLTLEQPIGQFFKFVVNGVDCYLPYNAPVYALSSHTLIVNIMMIIKIFMMLSIFSIQVNTTTTIGISYGIETILFPLKYIKVPTAEIGTVIAIAIKFVPNLFAEANAILRAQACRGLDLKNGNFIIKIKALFSLVVPMFSIAFNQADQLSDAMEARNYNPRIKRTRYRKYPIPWYQWIGFTIIVLLFILMIIMVAWKVIIAPFGLLDLHLV